MSTTKILVTGASGYIGGSILSQLLSPSLKVLRNIELSALVRGAEQAKLLADKGVNAILFSGLDDIDHIRRVSAENDMIINTASTFHPEAARAMIEGLSTRKERSHREVFYIHTSGTGSVADLPVSGAFVASRRYSDTDTDILSYLKMREAKHPFPQRTTDLEVTRLGKESDVNTYILMSPLIYGVGSGYFNRLSIQVPFYIRAAVERKVATVVSDGSARWSNIHIEDLAAFYEFFVAKLLNGESQASHDARGIYFTETGESSWLEIVRIIAHVGRELGVLETEDVESVALEDAASRWTGGNLTFAELGFASNSRTESVRGKNLGWEFSGKGKSIAAACMDEFLLILEEKGVHETLLSKAKVAK